MGAITTLGGVPRIHLELPTWNSIVGEGLDELLIAARRSPMA
ncbi:hypothetical protein ACI79J_15245 [Geodermatophilus sp. SYSU D01062]